jgi:hypothetical protein
LYTKSADDYRRTTNGPKSYNSRVSSPVPSKPAVDNQHPDDVHPDDLHPDNQHHHRHAIYAAEASGLLIMAVVLLILTVIRYWRDIPWSAR